VLHEVDDGKSLGHERRTNNIIWEIAHRLSAITSPLVLLSTTANFNL